MCVCVCHSPGATSLANQSELVESTEGFQRFGLVNPFRAVFFQT